MVGDASRNAVVCSTDSPDIAAVAREWGAEVPFVRPAALASDTASSDDVVLHALDVLEAQGREFAAVAKIQPTSPLALPEDLASGVTRCLEHGVSVVSVCAARPPSWTFRREPDGRLAEVVPDPPGVVRRQDYPPYCLVNGALQAAPVRRLRETRALFEAGVTLASLMPMERSVDVDDEDDLALAQLLLGARPVTSVAFDDDDDGRTLGDDRACFLVADASGTTGETALAAFVEQAGVHGADAVAMPASGWTAPLRERARARGLLSIGVLSEPSAAALATAAQCSAIWVSLQAASSETLGVLAQSGRPAILSVAGVPRSAVASALDALSRAVLEAPTLSALRELRGAFSRPVGLRCGPNLPAAVAAAAKANFVASDAAPDFARVALELRGAERALTAGP
jgi:CMP-N-acetylneuraminic acid synthetase